MSEIIEIDKPVTDANDVIASRNKAVLDAGKILCINIMGSPGSGKTS